MSAPVVEEVAVVAASPARPWFTKKRFILPGVAVIFFVAGASTGGSPATPTAAPVAAPVTTTVTSAPAECGTALDLAAEFITAVSTEHSALGAAFKKAGETGDIATMSTEAITAVDALNSTMDKVSAPMVAATTVCRAAIK